MYTDLRNGNGGELWVIDGGELDSTMDKLSRRGAKFEFTFRGNKATMGRAGWWLTGYPAERKLDLQVPTAITEENLNSLEPGDTVFHKAFGYGEVISIDREHGSIEVTLGVDKRGNPKARTFPFPNAFEQGFLSL